jgi:hypothetical protein
VSFFQYHMLIHLISWVVPVFVKIRCHAAEEYDCDDTRCL